MRCPSAQSVGCRAAARARFADARRASPVIAGERIPGWRQRPRSGHACSGSARVASIGAAAPEKIGAELTQRAERALIEGLELLSGREEAETRSDANGNAGRSGRKLDDEGRAHLGRSLSNRVTLGDRQCATAVPAGIRPKSAAAVESMLRCEAIAARVPSSASQRIRLARCFGQPGWSATAQNLLGRVNLSSRTAKFSRPATG
jgi:hypothetical protein